MSTTQTRISTIALICIPTIKQDEAVSFYEKLGFEKRVDTPFGGGMRWIEMYAPEGTTGITLAPPPPGQELVAAQTGIILETDDVEETHAQMKALGVDVDAQVSRMGDPVPPMFWFRDPSGHTLIVVQRSE
jgi:catechol 2,3-dioxygenase-like lactoylglutathione lyase family enzyme